MRAMLLLCVLSASCAMGEPPGDSKAGAGLALLSHAQPATPSGNG